MITPYYWRRHTFEAWRVIASEAERIGPWPEFARWARLMEQGLRKPALQCLRQFVESTRDWPASESRRFATWVTREVYRRRVSGNFVLPHPLVEGLLKPVFTAWFNEETSNPVPYRWLGSLTAELDPLRSAVRCRKDEQIARELFVAVATSQIEYSIHELPAGYVGNATDDMRLLEEAEEMSQGVGLLDLRDYLLAEVNSLKNVVASYLEYRLSSRETAFDDWAAENGRVSRAIATALPFPEDAFKRLCELDELGNT